MKKLGEKFEKYKPFEIEHIEIPDTGSKDEARFLEKYRLDKSVMIPSNEPQKHARKPDRVLRSNGIPSRMEDELNRVVVEIAPTARVYQIASDQADLAEPIKRTLSVYNYYAVELGLNVLTGQNYKIPDLRFEVDLKCDPGKDRKDVTAYSIAPKDDVKHIKVVGGKINLGISNLLKLIPFPIDGSISNLLNIVELEPWKFEWGFDRYEIEAAGELNYKVYWRIFKTNVVQGFNPTMILKARKNVNVISANVRSIYKLKAGWWDIEPDIRTKEQEIEIWPM